MIEVMKRADRPVAERAALSLVPLRNDIPDEAVCGTDLDLLQAFLATVLAFGPARTFFEAKRGLGEESSDSGFSGGDIDGFRFVGLGAGDQTFSAVGEVRANSGDRAEDEKPDHSPHF